MKWLLTILLVVVSAYGQREDLLSLEVSSLETQTVSVVRGQSVTNREPTYVTVVSWRNGCRYQTVVGVPFGARPESVTGECVRATARMESANGLRPLARVRATSAVSTNRAIRTAVEAEIR